MINLIPMAGLGTRFSKAGYRLSKPLILVSGKPMILRVIENLPPADKWIFIMRQEHISYGVDSLIKKILPTAIFIVIQNDTEGQASTCMLAKEYLNNDEELLIASCDNGFLYDREKFEKLKFKKEIDSIVWTLTRREIIRKNPTAWGWYHLEEDGETIEDISVKVPISNNPYEDHAVVATFWFRKANDFVKAAELMFQENYRIKNEFYVDSIPKFLKKQGKKTVIFDVDLYVGWGKPEDLHEYELIEFMMKYDVHLGYISEEYKLQEHLWKKYFGAIK